MSETEQRARVVAEARSYLGTPYHHAASLKGVGIDCAFLLIETYFAAGLIKRFDPRPYTRDWFEHRGEEKFLGLVLERAHEVEKPGVGDVMVFRLGRLFAHGAIVTRAEPLRIIHAFAQARRVVEDDVARNGHLAERPARFFSFWGAP